MNLFIFELKNVFLPEAILLIFIIANVLTTLTIGKKIYKLSSRIALIAILIPLLILSGGVTKGGYSIFSENYVQTNFTMVIRILILMGSFFTILLSQNIIKKFRFRAFEYYTILLIGTFSAMCLTGSNDFTPLIISLISLVVSNTFLIAYWNKYKPKEAAFKYFVTSGIAIGIMLFGISILYGLSGEINFSMLNIHYYGQDNSILFILSSMFIIFGLMFVTGCTPFNRWVPDVFQGSPYPIGAYLSYVPVVAGYGILARLLGNIMIEAPLLQVLLSVLSITSIFYGFFGLLRQNNIKRYLGYSTVAQSGFMLLGLSVFSNYGIASFVYFAIIYLFINYGIWSAGITFISCIKSDDIKDYVGLFYIRPYYTSAFVICLTALAGLPPTSGFLSRLYLYCSSMRLDLSGLPVLFTVVLISIVGVCAYFKLIGIMFEKRKSDSIYYTEQMNTKFVLYFCTIMTIITCFFANQIVGLSMFAAIGL